MKKQLKQNKKDEAATNHQPSAISSKKVPWGPGMAVLYAVAIYFAAQIIASLLVIIYPHLRGWSRQHAMGWLNTAVTAQFWYVLFAEALTVGAVWWFVHKRKSSLRAIGWRRPEWMGVVYALAGFFVYFVVYAVLLSIATHLFPSLNVNQKQQLGFNNATGTINLWLAFVSLVVLPPLAEETVFRGFVFTGLRNRFTPVWAAVITSVLFASAHLEFGSGQPLLWVAAIDTFTLSLVLCYLRQKTDSLWPGIFLHALKNGIAFTSLFLLHVH
jgi:membrane protease YdiL (CAAX protease family)